MSPENLVSATKAGRPASDQQHQRPQRELRDEHAEAHQRHELLEEREGAHDEAQRPRGGLAPRPLQLVVELGVLELGEVQRQRLLEDHLVDALAELGAQQRLAGVDAALRAAEQPDDDALERDELAGRGVYTGAAPACTAATWPTTASTTSLPIQAATAGSTPAATVMPASRIVELPIGGPDEVHRAARVLEHGRVAGEFLEPVAGGRRRADGAVRVGGKLGKRRRHVRYQSKNLAA